MIFGRSSYKLQENWIFRGVHTCISSMICALNKLIMIGEKLDLVQALREYGIKNELHIQLAGELNLVP